MSKILFEAKINKDYIKKGAKVEILKDENGDISLWVNNKMVGFITRLVNDNSIEWSPYLIKDKWDLWCDEHYDLFIEDMNDCGIYESESGDWLNDEHLCVDIDELYEDWKKENTKKHQERYAEFLKEIYE